MSLILLDKEHSRFGIKKKKKSFEQRITKIVIQPSTNFSILIFWNSNNITLIFLGMKDQWKFKIKKLAKLVNNQQCMREIVDEEIIEENVLN